ncbi:MAG: ATP-binding protein [Candidatus Latescibacteria bacterium]|nr:ATP-binding protein [Candidatus Latescibacterota bacterium]
MAEQAKQVVFDILSNTAEIQRANDKFSYTAKLWKIPQKAVFDIALVMEEILSLIVRLGKRINAPRINITLFLHNDLLIIILRYPGIQFNPLDINTTATVISRSEDEDVVGGLGMDIIKELANSISYERKGEQNKITIQKKIFSL